MSNSFGFGGTNATLILSKPGVTPKASYQASILRSGPMMRNCERAVRIGGDHLLHRGPRAWPRQTWAQPRKTRWSPVKPSMTGAGWPSSDR
jgi:hypothetical protein